MRKIPPEEKKDCDDFEMYSGRRVCGRPNPTAGFLLKAGSTGYGRRTSARDLGREGSQSLTLLVSTVFDKTRGGKSGGRSRNIPFVFFLKSRPVGHVSAL